MTQGIAAFGRDLDSVRQGLKDAAVKKDTPSKLKFKLLKRKLDRPFYQVVGLLESLWRLTEMNTPDGNIGKLTNEEIAADLEWDGDANALILMLIESRWIDRSEKHRLVIHDWSDHVPNWLKAIYSREGKSFSNEATESGTKSGTQSDTKFGTQSDTNSPALSPVLSSAPPILTYPNLTKPNQKTAATPMPECLQTDAFQEAWSDWQRHRSEIKKPLKPTMIVQQLKWLAKLGHDKAIATIENTITKGWVGLKEPEGVNGTAKSAPVKPRIPTDEELLRWNPTTGLD